MSAGSPMANAAQAGMVPSPSLSGTNQERCAVGLSPSGTRSVSVHTGTAHDSPTISTIAIGTPKSPSARRACKMYALLTHTHTQRCCSQFDHFYGYFILLHSLRAHPHEEKREKLLLASFRERVVCVLLVLCNSLSNLRRVLI